MEESANAMKKNSPSRFDFEKDEVFFFLITYAPDLQ